jgi:hypothetical protein
VGLRAEVVDFIGAHLAEDAGQVRAVGKVAVVYGRKARVLDVRVLVDVIDALVLMSDARRLMP